MKRLAGWTWFIVGTVVCFLTLMFGMNFLGRHYSAFSELWMFIAVICIFSTVITILAAGKAQQEDDNRQR